MSNRRRCPFCREPLPHPEKFAASYAFVYSDVLRHLATCLERPEGEEHDIASAVTDDLLGLILG